jgi:protein SCO1/2
MTPHLRRFKLLLILMLTSAASLILSGCMSSPKSASTASRAKGEVKQYQLRGQVVRMDPQAHAAVIQHQKIEGWMEAMTMEFPVKDEKEYNSLHSGDRIDATVFVQDLDYWIGNIRPQGGGAAEGKEPGSPAANQSTK